MTPHPLNLKLPIPTTPGKTFPISTLAHPPSSSQYKLREKWRLWTSFHSCSFILVSPKHIRQYMCSGCGSFRQWVFPKTPLTWHSHCHPVPWMPPSLVPWVTCRASPGWGGWAQLPADLAPAETNAQWRLLQWRPPAHWSLCEVDPWGRERREH